MADYKPTGTELQVRDEVKNRITNELQPFRQNLQTETQTKRSLEDVWRKADKLYPPHEFNSTAIEDWQARNSQPNVYSKIQTALAIIIDRNPGIWLKAGSKEFEAKNALMKALCESSWANSNSQAQLRLFAFNLAKYGWAVGRTAPRKFTRKIKELTFIDPETGVPEYQEKEIDHPNDIYFENINPWNAWIDDLAMPDDPWSVRDWAWRKVYHIKSLPRFFPEAMFPNVKKVSPGGNTLPDLSGTTSSAAIGTYQSKDLVECFFYENQETDAYHILANEVLLTKPESPLPYTHKRLSLNQTYWTPRRTDTPFGIGVPEVMEQDQDTLDKIRNMSIDQLVLSIYQMFFHGPQTRFSSDTLKVSPGKLIQVTNPQDIQAVKFQGPGLEADRWIERIEASMDETSGITKSLGGEQIGKTAFEANLNRESGLRKLKVPLVNIESVLSNDAELRIDLLQQTLSSPVDVTRIAGGKKMEEYMAESQTNPELYFVSGENLFRQQEVSLPVEEIEGSFRQSGETNFFNISPEGIRWIGEVRVIPQSIISPSKEIERQLSLDLFNLIAVLPVVSLQKSVRNVLKANDQDPDDWMPTKEEMNATQRMDDVQSAEAEAMGMDTSGDQKPGQGTGAGKTAVPRSETKAKNLGQGSGVGRLLQRLNPFRNR